LALATVKTEFIHFIMFWQDCLFSNTSPCVYFIKTGNRSKLFYGIFSTTVSSFLQNILNLCKHLNDSYTVDVSHLRLIAAHLTSFRDIWSFIAKTSI